MVWVVVDGLVGGEHGGGVHDGLTGAQVAADAGVGAAGDLQTEPVTGLELVRRGSHVHLDQ